MMGHLYHQKVSFSFKFWYKNFWLTKLYIAGVFEKEADVETPDFHKLKKKENYMIRIVFKSCFYLHVSFKESNGGNLQVAIWMFQALF